MSSAGIEWTDRVWNPIRGCSPVSPGCAHCYAATFARRFSREDLPYHGLVTKSGKWNGRVRFESDRLSLPQSWHSPSRIFVNSMSDLFHSAVTDQQIAAVFGVMQAVACQQHTFQILTKRPERAAKWFAEGDKDMATWCGETAGRAIGDSFSSLSYGACGPWPPPNVHLLASCEDQRRLDERVPDLIKCPAAVRGVSLEPLLGPIDLRRHLWVGSDGGWEYEGSKRCWIDWVIVGCETGPWRRPCDVRWILDIVRQCREAGVPCFVKQIEAKASGGTRVSKEPREWPAELQVRMFPGDRWT